MVIYTVRAGDTLNNIASRYGISADDIAYDNQIPFPYALAVGASLLLTQASYTLTSEDILISNSERPVYSGGYAYPFIADIQTDISFHIHILAHFTAACKGFT